MTKKQIKQRLGYWQRQLGLDNWHIEIFYDLKKKSKLEAGNYVTAAHTESLPEYKSASISFNPKQLHAVDDEVLIHELLHCLTSFLLGSFCKKCMSGVEYYNETITSELSRIILRMKKQK